MKLWIARDGGEDSDFLGLYSSKPTLDEYNDWDSDYERPIGLPSDMFPEITFKNSPQEVKLVSKNISESIINEFMNTLNFIYDKSEKCMVAKIYNSDLTSLKDIIESKL
jgi:hypothetical protein